MKSRGPAEQTKRRAAIPTTSKTEPISTANKGRHAELIAITALLANGWQVMEPTTPDVFDLGITHPGRTSFERVQVKTARPRIKNGAPWIIVSGTRNNGQVYSKDEVDLFIGVHQGVAYMFDNTGLTEYWCKPAELSEKWTRLDASIENVGRPNISKAEAI